MDDPNQHRCPSCGLRIPGGFVGTCERCGYRVAPTGSAGEDKTPFAESPGLGLRAYLATCWWLWTAGSQRLAHLGLMRCSRDSRRFRTITVILLAASVGVLLFGLMGWHTATRLMVNHGEEIAGPAGKGWYEVAVMSPPIKRTLHPHHPIGVWWNPAAAIVAGGAGFVLSLVLLFCAFAWQGWRARRRLGAVYSEQERLGAALHYATGWLVGVPPACLWAALTRVADVSAAGQWVIVVPRATFYGPAVVVGVISLAAYSFGLVRVGGTVPMAVRTKMSTYFGLWHPIWMLVFIGGLGAGFYFGFDWLFGVLGLGA